jgi:hypothetical protein
MDETIRRCSFEQWHPIFAKDGVATRIIPLPDEFKTFLLHGQFIDDDSLFPDFRAAVESAIEDLDGKIFPKLNFTAPLDAQWLSQDGTIAAKSFHDLLYLLKGSTRILIDLTAPFGEVLEVPAVLVLKKWMAYRRHRELRVFVKSPGLYAVTSRYCDIGASLTEDEIEEYVDPFIESACERFPGDRLIFDLYVTSKFRVHMLDIAPWNDVASTGLFSREELEGMSEIETRLADGCDVRRPEDPAVPIEMQDGKSLAEVIELMKECRDEQ